MARRLYERCCFEPTVEPGSIKEAQGRRPAPAEQNRQFRLLDAAGIQSLAAISIG